MEDDQVCEVLSYEGVEAYKKEAPQVHAAPGCQAEGGNYFACFSNTAAMRV